MKMAQQIKMFYFQYATGSMLVPRVASASASMMMTIMEQTFNRQLEAGEWTPQDSNEKIIARETPIAELNAIIFQ
jgi:hypothetical protein